ncbi:TPA: hypothetical protein DF272_04580 [Candidatus Falkowbacteria bacterium]|nr:hypothetical protein [Candidatus Falkowbacteria bacterium]
MRDEQNTALVRVSDLKSILDGDAEALIRVRENPGNALAVLSEVHRRDGMPVAHQSRVLEIVVGEVSDVGEARRILAENTMPDFVEEMHAHRGDLPSVLDMVATAEGLLSALLVDLNHYMIGDPRLFSFYIRGWAQKVCQREDWEALLEREIFGFTLRDHLLIACYWDSFAVGGARDEYEADVTDDMFTELNLDPEESRDRLQEMLDNDLVPKFDPEDLAEFQQAVADRRRLIEDERQQAALDDAKELDI